MTKALFIRGLHFWASLNGITPERDDFRRIVIPLWLIAGAWCSRTPAPSPIKAEQAVSGPCSVATHAPANDDDQIPVLGPQAPGEEITVSLLATTAPLGYALGDPLAHAPASTILVFISVSAVSLLATTAPLGDPLAQAPAQASTILLFLSVSRVADPLAEATPQVLPVLHKVDDEIPQILPGPYPVLEEIAQIAVRIAISVAPSLSWCWACCRTNHWGRCSNRENCCSNHWQPCHCVLLSEFMLRSHRKTARPSSERFL
jgi:hypothetical protein